MKVVSFIGLVLLVSMSACVKVIDADLEDSERKVVIRGLITNEPGPYFVKVNRTASFYGTESFPNIDNATVVLSDDLGNNETLTSIGNGMYSTNTFPQGAVGRTYTLTVTADGKTYTAQDRLYSVSSLDTLYYEFHTVGGTYFEEGNYIYTSLIDPPNEMNYYLFNFYRNDTLVNEPNQIFALDDRFLAQNINDIEGPVVYGSQQWAKVELLSLSPEIYNYYFGLTTLLQNDGGFFSTPPANPSTNINNGALGLFQASAVAKDSIYIP